MQIDANFPAGNILVEKIEGDTAYIRHDLRDTPRPWFYWCFRVRGAPSRKINFQFTGGDVLGARGPAVSRDGGRTWEWLGRDPLNAQAAFRYRFDPAEEDVLFSFCPTYHSGHLIPFLLDRLGRCPLEVAELCKTAKGRSVLRLRLGRLDGQAPEAVLLACRHHACEAVASYALEGLMDEVGSDHAAARSLRERVEFLILPFADTDGVEEGDQGKYRHPHDYCVDYAEPSLYPSVRALKAFVPGWARGRLRAALDIHCPWMRGGDHEQIHFAASPGADDWDALCRLSNILKSVQSGPLLYEGRCDLRAGESWNHEPPGQLRFASWAAQLPGVRLTATVELPYASVSGQAVTPDTARAFGRDLARALAGFLAEGREGAP